MDAQRRPWRHLPRRARGIERVEHDVLVVSIDRLTHVLRIVAGIGPDERSSG
jgi:hypothetical protein